MQSDQFRARVRVLELAAVGLIGFALRLSRQGVRLCLRSHGARATQQVALMCRARRFGGHTARRTLANMILAEGDCVRECVSILLEPSARLDE